MYINPQDMLYVVATICLIWVTGFLCWALYETARLMRQSNEVVTEARVKIEAVEEFVDDAMEKVSSLSSYAGMLTRAGEAVLGMLHGGRGDDSDEEILPRRKIKKVD
ncbi:MAG: hypothetical protein WCK01_03075 [Candidatus Uhrbacteria bacterium]